MVRVKFWLDHSDHSLHVQDVKTEEVKAIRNQKQIAWFLNAHNLTSDQLKGPMNGFDALRLFKKKNPLDLIPRLKRKK